jgi:hypothetical protein
MSQSDTIKIFLMGEIAWRHTSRLAKPAEMAFWPKMILSAKEPLIKGPPPASGSEPLVVYPEGTACIGQGSRIKDEPSLFIKKILVRRFFNEDV